MRIPLTSAAILGALGILLLGNGCTAERKPADPSVTQAWEAPTPVQTAEPAHFPLPPPPAPEPRDPAAAYAEPIVDDVGNPIALVNGLAIDRQRVADILIDAYGADLVDLLIRLELAKARAAAEGLGVSREDVRAEYEQALRRISSPVLDSGDRFDRRAAERVLDSMLQRNGVSKTQFMLKIEQDAYLRKLAERDVVVDDKLLPAEHDRVYGPRVQIRHMQLDSLAAASQVREQLDAGVDFDLLVRKYSRNEVTAAGGGLLPPFSRHDDVPPLLREAAFSLEDGQVSNVIFENGSYHIIRVERHFPPSEVPVDLVADELRERLRRRLVEERMRQLAADLFDRADLEITDPALARRLREKYPNARIR
jgi:parvulin-like peptidyl-prolyl isomerase